MSIRVLVADDQSMIRAGFRMLLAIDQPLGQQILVGIGWIGAGDQRA